MLTLPKGIFLFVASLLLLTGLLSGQAVASESDPALIVLGSYSSPRNAEQMLASLLSITCESLTNEPLTNEPLTNESRPTRLLNIVPVTLGIPLYRVTASPFNSRAEARQQLKVFRQYVPDAWLETFSGSGTSLAPRETLPADREVVQTSHASDTKMTILIQRVVGYQAAVASAQQLSQSFAMPLLIVPEEPASESVAKLDARYQIQTPGVDQAIAPLVLALVKKQFPLARLEPSAQ